ncbi:hypothetical protein [Bacillus sp. 2205SS5-2]|uniref:hypothetical protein n=1 Tax=Bacillus sp. 2205SS5-2 TaxID=3109031 RepID=UPI00300665C8
MTKQYYVHEEKRQQLKKYRYTMLTLISMYIPFFIFINHYEYTFWGHISFPFMILIGAMILTVPIILNPILFQIGEHRDTDPKTIRIGAILLLTLCLVFLGKSTYDGVMDIPLYQNNEYEVVVGRAVIEVTTGRYSTSTLTVQGIEFRNIPYHFTEADSGRKVTVVYYPHSKYVVKLIKHGYVEK